MAQLWGGRFTGGPDPLMQKYNDSLPFDRVFWKQDIAGSIAYARANIKTGILTEQEFAELEKGFKEVSKEWETDTFEPKATDEDIHTANERRLSEVIDKQIAFKLHTGRSRNDQVATDLRMWLRDQLRDLETHLANFLKATVSRAEKDIDFIMPGYTHLQRAQPVRWSHWMLSHAFAISQDLERLREVRARVNRCPLGSGALSGNAFGVDRDAIAKELGFEGITYNSLNSVGDRDFIYEVLQWGSMFMIHLSRWAEDLIVYSSLEFGYVRLSDAYSTGSSLMPQKKNADSLELLRGKTGRIFGQMCGVHDTIKGLPSTYNKDLQETVEPMLTVLPTLIDSTLIATGVISTLTVNPSAMLAACTPDMLATEIADYLVRSSHQVPFREAHHISGRVVALAEKEGVRMDKLTFEQLQEVDKRFEEDVVQCWDNERAVEMKSAKGGTSRKRVMEQIEILKGMLIEDEG